jgi:hypothetical protein
VADPLEEAGPLEPGSGSSRVRFDVNTTADRWRAVMTPSSGIVI